MYNKFTVVRLINSGEKELFLKSKNEGLREGKSKRVISCYTL